MINDVVIMWFINELVLIDCMFSLLFMMLVFLCEFGLWFESSFQGGSYEFSICLFDLGNNFVGFYVYKW